MSDQQPRHHWAHRSAELSDTSGVTGGAGPVLVGMMPGQPAAVILNAAALAVRLGVELVCAYVDVASYPVTGRGGAPAGVRPIDPDTIDDGGVEIPAELTDRLGQVLASSPVVWSLQLLSGDPARALGVLAASLQATMIVVGTREHGIGARLEDLLTGSVAVHLTHRQHCPVLVVPLAPGGARRER
ncbi:universal stress protein [Paenarthrobacter sp. PH39-S1]|uniref:universal stress protein n=1 Tax=Paenarthrobacter sp. PH39-S1 TaxID=3046204 RepID=UPI0024BB5E03|nr:universal stress protein [Paenarthrobacter sp. PH39-S1]MDJ0355324.1 universal stress protein [Paenarthrobacter sp. PH39-S1]